MENQENCSTPVMTTETAGCAAVLKKKLSDETSKKIAAIRIILMILVVFAHNNYNELSLPGGGAVFNQSVFGKWVQLLISDGLARGAVPVFFTISAFLLYYKKNSYSVVLKKKAKSIFLPFILWPVVNMLFFAAVKFIADVAHIGFLDGVGNYDFLTWTPKEWFSNFFGYGGDGILYLSHFWFLRDLIILTIISPVLSLLYDKAKVLYVAAIIYIEFVGIFTYFIMPESLFYFSVGMIWAKSDFDIFELAGKIKWYEIIPVFLGLWLILWKFQRFPVTTVTLMAFADFLMLMKFSQILIKNEKVYNALVYFSTYSFFLYAVHIKILRAIIRTVWIKVLPMTNGFFCLAEYFGVTILMIASGIGLGILLKKICPPLFNILNGR